MGVLVGLVGNRVRLPDPGQLTVCLQPIVAGFDHATSLHVHICGSRRSPDRPLTVPLRCTSQNRLR